MSAPLAHGQDSPAVNLGVWAYEDMILGDLLLPLGGPGYVDIVGKPCEPGEGLAKWGVSVRPMSSSSAPLEHITTNRMVIPKQVNGQDIGKPSLDNVQLRRLAPLPEHAVVEAYQQHLAGLDEAAARELNEAVAAEILARNPNAIHRVFSQPEEDPATSGWKVLDGFGGKFWGTRSNPYPTETAVGTATPEDIWDETAEATPLLDATGSRVRVLASERNADGSIRVVYQPLPDDLVDSGAFRQDSDLNPDMTPGRSTSLDRVVYETTISPEQFATLTQLPPGEVLEADFDRDLTTIYEVMAEKVGISYAGPLSVDAEGALYGGLVLPVAQTPAEAVEVADTIEGLDRISAGEENLFYAITESEDGTYWVIDFATPPMQASFDVTVDTPEDAAAAAGAYVPAQVYTAQTCTRWSNELAWECESLFEYPWGRGGNTESHPDSEVTENVVRGTLEIPQGATAAELRRGIFGNPSCMVTRPTEDPDNLDALASTILPTDYNNRFPGQPENPISPADMFLEGAYIDDIPMRGANDGPGWINEDACDQAAVPLVCSADTPPGGSSLPGAALLGSALLSSGTGSSSPDVSSPAPAQTTVVPQPQSPAQPAEQAQPA
ncbi:hypothetical protein, partial [Corynebacterium nasicanis]